MDAYIAGVLLPVWICLRMSPISAFRVLARYDIHAIQLPNFHQTHLKQCVTCWYAEVVHVQKFRDTFHTDYLHILSFYFHEMTTTMCFILSGQRLLMLCRTRNKKGKKKTVPKPSDCSFMGGGVLTVWFWICKHSFLPSHLPFKAESLVSGRLEVCWQNSLSSRSGKQTASVWFRALLLNSTRVFQTWLTPSASFPPSFIPYLYPRL